MDQDARANGPSAERMDGGDRGRAASVAFTVAFWTAALLLAWVLCRRSITLGDEGHFLSESADLAAGRVPYRDFDLFVTPGAWVLNAIVFRVFGVSVLATRVVAGLSLVAMMAAGS